jgi:hypothetical protein
MNRHHFIIDQTESNPIVRGSSVYIEKDYALDYRCRMTEQRKVSAMMDRWTSLAFDTLQILIDIESRTLLYPFGYFPKSSWEPASLAVPASMRRRVYLGGECQLVKDITVSYDVPNHWRRYFDKTSGWLLYGNMPGDTPTEPSYIEFAEGCVLCLSQCEICSIWLKPQWL